MEMQMTDAVSRCFTSPRQCPRYTSADEHAEPDGGYYSIGIQIRLLQERTQERTGSRKEVESELLVVVPSVATRREAENVGLQSAE